jgi:FhuF 2Fe-2S C-terminal domain
VTTNAAALHAAAALGPYFAVQLAADGPDWLGLQTLVDDPEQLRERVATTRRLLAQRCELDPETIEERAAASIYFLGLAARLVSPALGSAVVTGAVPQLALSDVWWQPVAGGPIPIALTNGLLREATSPDLLADLLYDDVVATTVTPLAAVVQREFHLSPQVVWGNVASAIAGAAKMIGVARPDLASQAAQLADRLLSRGLLSGTGRFVQPDPALPERHFVRNNCCLFYRLPGGGLCADCVLLSGENR